MAKFKTLALALALAAASPASAGTITFTDTLLLTDADTSGNLSVSGFDSSLGTLVGVSWSITGALASILGVTNFGNSVVSGTVFTNVDFDLDSAVLSLTSSPDFSIFASTGIVTLGGGESILFPITAQSTVSGTEAPSSAFFSPFDIVLSYFTTTSFGASGFGGDISVSQATDVGLEFSITYEYEELTVPPPIPLPAAGFLLLVGAGALAAVGRRRRS